MRLVDPSISARVRAIPQSNEAFGGASSIPRYELTAFIYCTLLAAVERTYRMAVLVDERVVDLPSTEPHLDTWRDPIATSIDFSFVSVEASSGINARSTHIASEWQAKTWLNDRGSTVAEVQEMSANAKVAPR
jgi:hypothetical protein